MSKCYVERDVSTSQERSLETGNKLIVFIA